MNDSRIAQKPHGFVLCADDYAMTPGVSAGILTLLQAEAISATGAMTNRPFWRVAARDLASFSGKADLGVHLSLTCGEPLTPAKALAPEGTFSSLGTLLMRFHRGAIPKEEIRDEIAAQLDAFEDEMGHPPDFIDGHQHVHAMPGIAQQVMAVVAARYPERGPYLRDASDAPSAIFARRVHLIKALGVAALAKSFGEQARVAGFITNRGFSGFSAFDPAQDYSADFARSLAASGPTPLIMCHPGYIDAELRALDPAIESRPKEVAFFLSGQFAQICDRAGLRPMRMKALQSAA